MGIDDMVKKWVFSIALKKGVVSAAKLIVSYCATKGIIFVGNIFGVMIDTGSQATIEAALTVALNSGLTVVRNWLKLKFPGKFEFL